MDESKVSLIRTLCGNLNVKLVRIYRPQYGESIGALAGIPIYRLTNEPYRGEDFSQEMMVMCGFKPDELDAFLKAYREAGIPPVCPQKKCPNIRQISSSVFLLTQNDFFLPLSIAPSSPR